MSLILDALKKLEQERAARRQNASDIAFDIIQPEQVKPRREILIIAGAVAFTILAAAAAAYTLVTVLDKSTPVSAVAPLANQQVNAVPSSTSAPPAPLELPASPKAENAPQKQVSQPDRKTEKKPPVPKVTQPEKSAAVADKGPPASQSLIISVIVWFDEPSERKAVVNGISVREGDMIEGAKVERIYPTRISFVKNRKPFDVDINK